MKIGVLALQGAFIEHVKMLRSCGAEAFEVRNTEQLEGVDGLIIPGGESTTIGKLMVEYGFDRAIPELARSGVAIYGTCAGLILLAKEIAGSDQFRLGLMDMEAHRNAFGRQRESFETDLAIPELGSEPFRAVFIRAPYVTRVFGEAKALAEFHDRIVMIRQGRFLATAFHPELTGDPRIHQYFLDIAAGRK